MKIIDDIDILDNIIVGRVDPKIYAFTTETVPNYIKVGDTYRPLKTRLDEWRKLFPNLEKKFDAIAKVDDTTFFRDHAVHYFLEHEAGKEKLKRGEIKNIPYYSQEFFKGASKKDIDNAIEDIKKNHKDNQSKYQYYKFDESLVSKTYTYIKLDKDYDLRPNQDQTVKKFKKAIESGRNNLLMYAVMRFGKSFTSMCCAVEIKAGVVLVVSAKADVESEWKKTIEESPKKFADYVFLNRKDLLDGETVIKDKQNAGRSVVIFLTLQDLQGKNVKRKHKELFKTQIDLLIIDETHFGARAEEYGRVLRDISITNKKDVKRELELSDETLDELDKAIKTLNARVRLHLSGTPYRILMGSEFKDEDVIAFYQFSDIAEDQKRWDQKYLHEDEVKEWDNPYYGFPQMVRFAFNPNESSRKKMEELKSKGASHTLSTLLKPQSIQKDIKDGLHKKFVHESEVLDLFKVIDGSKKDENILHFLDYEKIKTGKMCQHIVCVLPYRASCDALEALLKNNKFKNLNDYEIVNISGVDNEQKYKKIQTVKSNITKRESKNQKTITLTVNRMLTGSTVPQWDTMLYFKDTTSPQEYDQAVFRLQNQYVRTFTEPNGDMIKFNMKPQTILVDFSPNRMFEMQEQKALIYNANTDKKGNAELKKQIQRELDISPIIVLNKNKIKEITSTDILDAVRDYSKDRGVDDEARAIPIDVELLDVPEIRAEIERQNEIGSKQGLEVSGAEGEGDGLAIDEASKEDNKNEKSEEGLPTDDKEAEEDFRKKFATYYMRILFFAFLTNSKVESLQDIIKEIKSSKNNTRIINSLGINKDVLALFQKRVNLFALAELDQKIHNINSLANDNSLDPIERASIAMKKFTRLSESEVVTPELIADKMIDTLPEKEIKPSTRILDMASKQGEFTYAIYKKFGKKIANNVHSIPTSKAAYEFTRKVYEALGLNVDNIERKYTSYQLIEDSAVAKDKNVKINGTNMKFNVIVGNPPYQQSISSSSANKSLSKQLFPDFITTCVNLNPDYLSLITPSRWFAGDAQDKSFLKLREFFRKNNHIEKIVNFPASQDVFSGVGFPGAVNFFLYNTNYNGDVEFVEYKGDKNKIIQRRPLFEEGLSIILSDGLSYEILSKVKKSEFISLTTITKGRNAFGITGKQADGISFKVKKVEDYELRCRYEEIRYVDKKYITKNQDLADSWKIFISKANGAAGLLSDNKAVSILGNPYLSRPKTVCTDSLIPIGSFKTSFEATALMSYIHTKFLRYLVGILKVSQNIYQNVYEFVPLQNFTQKSDIDWSKPVAEIDKQLYKKYKLDKKEIKLIESHIKEMK